MAGGPDENASDSVDKKRGANSSTAAVKAASPAPQLKLGPGATHLQALLRGGGHPTVANVVALLDRYPREQGDLLLMLQPTLGNDFVQRVIEVMTKSRGQQQAETPGKETNHEIPIDPILHQPSPLSHPHTATSGGGPTEVEQGQHKKQDPTKQDDVHLNQGHPRWRTLASVHEQIVEKDADGDVLMIDADYKLEARPGETEIEQTHIETNRRLVLTLANGQKAYATLHGEAIALIEADGKLDPVREIHEQSVQPENTGQIYLPATEEYLPTVFGAKGQSLSKSISGDGLLDYDDPLKQLAALKASMRHVGVTHGGDDLATAHKKAKELRGDEPRIAHDLRQHIARRKNFEDGDPTSIARAEDYVREINRTLAMIGEHRHGESADKTQLVALREEILALRDEARAAHAPHKSFGENVLDVGLAPVRLAERIGGAGLELGKTIVDGAVLGIDALGAWTGIGTFDWKPISAVGKAAEGGATSSDVAKGIVTGIIDQWSTAVQHARHGDYSALLDTSIDTLLIVDSAADMIEYAAVKAPVLASKAAGILENAKALIADVRIPTEVADNAAALAKGIEVWWGPGKSPAMQMAGGHGSGPSIPTGGATLGEARAAARAVKLERAKGRAVESMKTRAAGSEAAPEVTRVADRVESAFQGDANAGAAYFKELELRQIDTSKYLAQVEKLLDAPHLAPAEVMGALRRSVGSAIDPISFLDRVNSLARRPLPGEAIRALVERAGNGKLDLEWLTGTKLTDAELIQLSSNPNTPWDQFKRLSQHAARGEPLPSGEYVSANIHVRGAAAEIVAAQEKNLPKGFRIKSKVFGDGTVTDYVLVDAGDNLAELEVKGARGENWPAELAAALDKDDPKISPALQRLVDQMKGAKAREHPVYLAVSNSLSNKSLLKLQRFLETKDAAPKEIILMNEDEIIEAGEAIREHLGIPQPKLPAPRTK